METTVPGAELKPRHNKMLLVDTLKLEKYYAPCISKVIGVEYQGFCIFGAYTQRHLTAPTIFDSLCQIRESDEFAEKTSIFLMVANAHSVEWLGSKGTNDAGECAQAFSENYGIQQWIGFLLNARAPYARGVSFAL